MERRLIGSGTAWYSLSRFWALSLALLSTFGAMMVGTIVGLERLWERWTDYPYDHALVIVAMSAWLAIHAVRNRRIETIHPSAAGSAALVLTLIVYVVAERADSALGMQTTLPLMLLAITATIAGLSAASRLALPILFLYFAIPVWDLAITPLQVATTATVGTALHWTGFAAFIEDNRIHIPAGTFEIAEGCAGLRYFVVSFALATFYGLLYLRTWATSFALIAVALAAAILCNWIRVYSLVVIGDVTEMQHYLIAVSHSRFGWFIYALSLIPVFAVGVLLERRTKQVVNERQRSSGIALASASRYLTTAALASAILTAPTLIGL